MDNTSLPTRGQLERRLSQKIQALYRSQLDHQPSKINCQLCEATLAIIIEESITAPEQLLVENGQDELAEKVRSDLEKAIQPQIQEVIEEVLQVSVIDFLSDAKLDTGRTGMIAVLAGNPAFRHPKREKSS